MKKTLSIFLLAITLVSLGFILIGKPFKPKVKADSREVAISSEAPFDVANPNEIATEEPSVFVENPAGEYVEYNKGEVKQAAKNGNALILFAANWCSSCKAIEKDLLERANKIPSDLTIFRADYDTAKELKKEYGVLTQHTFVQVDENGNEITKWVGGDTIEEVVSNLKN